MPCCPYSEASFVYALLFDIMILYGAHFLILRVNMCLSTLVLLPYRRVKKLAALSFFLGARAWQPFKRNYRLLIMDKGNKRPKKPDGPSPKKEASGNSIFTFAIRKLDLCYSRASFSQRQGWWGASFATFYAVVLIFCRLAICTTKRRTWKSEGAHERSNIKGMT